MKEIGNSQLLRGAFAGASLALAALIGCGLDLEYLLPQAAGQFEIVAHSVPIEEAMASGELSDEQVEKLSLLLEAREHATGAIGLNTQDNYELFYNTRGEPVAFNVSACAKTAFAPKRWSFPVVGTVPYLGYFNEEQALAKVSELRDIGFDVLSYDIDAYSTLDILPDPVFSGMLDRNDLSMVETVFHELLHSTIWHNRNTSFNESLATFVGRTAAVDFFVERYADQPDYAETAFAYYEDIDRYNAFLFELFETLDEFYRSDRHQWDKEVGREAVYQAGRDRFAAEVLPQMNRPDNFAWAVNLPTNNAWMLANIRYNLNLELFRRVHEATEGEWSASLAVFERASQASDPFAFLEDWLAERGLTAVGSSAVRARLILEDGVQDPPLADSDAVFFTDPGPRLPAAESALTD